MKEEYHKWHTNHLDREFEMLVLGHAGYPLILFPTSTGYYYENKDNGLIEAAAPFIESGKVKIYCPESIDHESWYNFEIHPSDRVRTHNTYENLILSDVIAFAMHETGSEKVALAGCSLGAYHAFNLGFRHPHLASHLISMGGTFDIKQFIFGYYDDNCYFNNPPDYLPGLTDPVYLNDIKKMGITLGTGTYDICLGENILMSGLLKQKGINHLLDVVDKGQHDWPWWKEMFPRYLANIFS